MDTQSYPPAETSLVSIKARIGSASLSGLRRLIFIQSRSGVSKAAVIGE